MSTLRNSTSTEDSTHHHHHHHHHKDEADLFRENQAKARRHKKQFSELLFWGMSLTAVIVVLAVFWIYTHE